MTPRDTVARLAADAARLVVAASPDDWPGGFHVVAERLAGRTAGLSVGDGVALARVYGRRCGAAVVVNVSRLVLELADPGPNQVAALEAIVLHEGAHALVGAPVEVDATDNALAAAPAAIPTYTPETLARMHHPRWAAALWLMATRGATYRPRSGRRMLDAVGMDLARYGYTPGDLETVTRGVDAMASLRVLLAAGGAGAALVEACLPDIEQRTAAIVVSGVAGGATTGVVG